MNRRFRRRRRNEEDDTTAVPAGQAQSAWRMLQQSIGNAALSRVLGPAASVKRDGETDDEEQPVAGEEEQQVLPEGGGEEMTQAEEPVMVSPEQMAADAVSGDTLGTIEDDEPIVKEDAPRFAAMRPSLRSRERSRTAAGAAGLPIEAHLTLDSDVHRGEMDDVQEGKPDAVEASISFGSNVVKGSEIHKESSYGETHTHYKVDNPSYKIFNGKVVVTGRIFLDIDWATQSRGRTDINGPTSGEITKDNWGTVASDLTPNDRGWPERTKFYALDLTEKHEQFHVADDIQRAQAYLPSAISFLNSQTIAPSDNPGVMGYQMGLLFAQVQAKVKADGWAYYNAGGEDRAYGAGKSDYESRASAIYARAHKEKWG